MKTVLPKEKMSEHQHTHGGRIFLTRMCSNEFQKKKMCSNEFQKNKMFLLFIDFGAWEKVSDGADASILALFS